MKVTPPPEADARAASTAVGGDASGSTTNITVIKVQGVPVDLAGATDGDVLTYVLANNDLELLPPGGGPTGVYLTTTLGEQARYYRNAAAGAAVTLDCSIANTFDLTLTANCVLTITNPPPAGVDGHIVVVLRQGGVGSFTVTWPASVAWPNATTGLTGGSAPTLYTAVGAQDSFELSTVDGGVTWGGTPKPVAAATYATPAIVLGTAAAAGAATTGIRSDATIVAFDATVPANIANPGVASSAGSAAKAARRDHVHALTYHAEPLTDGASNFIFDGGDIVVVVGVPN